MMNWIRDRKVASVCGRKDVDSGVVGSVAYYYQ